ncbi:MAG: hypothetical protein U9R25_00830 [Chloroflexota bacterium]|nr:hypothetical protein [Chloroflexota bacterium]
MSSKTASQPIINYRVLSAVAALSAATLILEGSLLRLLAVAQFYHFAFLVISLALLGFGASGSLLTVSARLQRLPVERLLAGVGVAFLLSTGLAYLVVNLIPFDSYSIAWDRRQIPLFLLYYLALALPFVCSGLGIGGGLAKSPGYTHLVYASNLIGSAIGALLAPLILALAGVPGGALAAGMIGLLAVILVRGRPPVGTTDRRWITALLLAAVLTLLSVLGWFNLQGRAILGMTISPYKGLANALRYPGAQQQFQGWNAISRVDGISQAGIRQLPGLSYTYFGTIPEQQGVAVDANTVSPLTEATPETFPAAGYLPEAIAFQLRPNAKTLVVNPAAGLAVLQALAGDAESVTSVLENGLVARAVANMAPDFNVFEDERVRSVIETPRVFLQQDSDSYDIVLFPLADSYRPVTSGAYSLSETYGLTKEAMAAALERLSYDGLLVATRWLQNPPSEDVKLLATAIEALVDQGVESPGDSLAALRGIQTITVLLRPGGWTSQELAALRSFAEEKRFDLVWLPDIQENEVNRYNRLSQPALFEATRTLLDPDQRERFYQVNPYAIRPATDDHPFFFHFFTWRQTREVLGQLGQSWQPFGGSGYLLLLALLALVLVLSILMILAPLLWVGNAQIGQPGWPAVARTLLYFSLLGVAFLFVEIPLIQRSILILGHPTYAFAVVVISLLFFSGIGSILSGKPDLPSRRLVGALVIVALLTPWVIALISDLLLGLPFGLRALLSGLSLAPLGVLMGMPFPLGLAWLEGKAPGLVAWAWAVNGCASVVASVMAAILALAYGFTVVLSLGALAYGLAWVTLFLHKPASASEGLNL